VAPKKPDAFKAAAKPLPTRRPAAAIATAAPEKKKAVTLEGPLSNRKIVSHSIPPFPARAREQGVIEAEVQIRFYVGPTGNVIEGRMSVERPSGYGYMDRLAMDHLKRWRFEPLPLGGRDEWGLITFRFELE